MVYPAVGAMLDRSLVAALAFVGVLGLAAAAFARAPAPLFAEPHRPGCRTARREVQGTDGPIRAK
jgi:hypothetical protein